ncbi:hypothetical protein N0V93_003021 [Gnomoniopsis smithogilvyi]|uniref:Uncharacterized protein n=1 Tax=Gnomoniopsis smithogilvyi TaxID=1191159 RepID=A0A9W9CYR3_9PEZI|nr:hypothetical protein N0V93_003021 [Gnomoniopsis smithogilvyi]
MLLSDISQRWNVVDVGHSIDAMFDALSQLEKLINSHQTAFNEAIRPFARNLKVFDLPPELLIMIFTNFRPDTRYCMASSHTELYRDIESIQNVRLTCIRFREASDHLLLRCVDVEILSSSLERLHRISQRYAVSQGVRAVRIDLRFYSRLLARHKSDYINFARDELETAIASLQTTTERIQDDETQGTLKQELLGLIAKGKRISAAWMSYNDTQKLPRRNPKSRAAVRAIISGYEEYHRRYADHALVLERGFAECVAEAVKRMPKACSLFLRGQSVENKKVLVNSYGRRMSVRQVISEIGHFPVQWSINPIEWKIINTRPDEKLPIKLLWQIPIEFHKAGVQLLQLDILAFPGIGITEEVVDLDWKFEDQDHAELKVSAQDLELFKYRGPYAEVEDDLTSFQNFLCALISGPRMKEINICFISCAVRGAEDVLCIMAVPIKLLLSSITAPEAACTLNGGFIVHPQEIQEMLHEMPSWIVFEDLFMQDGNWADVLDILRSRTWDCLEIRRPHGGDCEDMDEDEYADVFDGSENEMGVDMNKASLYICRNESQIFNPLRPAQDEQDGSGGS